VRSGGNAERISCRAKARGWKKRDRCSCRLSVPVCRILCLQSAAIDSRSSACWLPQCREHKWRRCASRQLGGRCRFLALDCPGHGFTLALTSTSAATGAPLACAAYMSFIGIHTLACATYMLFIGIHTLACATCYVDSRRRPHRRQRHISQEEFRLWYRCHNVH